MLSLRARWTAVCLVIAISIFVPTLLSAQGANGRILGRVADPSGAVLANAKITITNEATAISRDALTNDSGDYSFIEVAPGTYTVQFELTGFKKNVQKGVIVDLNQTVTLNSTLQIGGSQETVDVTSEAPQVDTTSTQLGAVINDRSVNELPLNTRDTYQFLQLQPGVQAQLGSSGTLFAGTSDAGSVSVNGGRTRANNFSVNGGDANDQFVNTPTIQPTPDAVEEFRVITNTFDAEYGRNSGSVVNVITKSGGNTFHGNIYEYFRNTILDARGYPDTTTPQLNQNQFGGTFGGPIKKDRTFFFFSYEGRRIRDGVPGQLLNVPTSSEYGGDFSGAGGFAPPIPATAPGGPSAGAGGIDASSGTPFVAQVLDGRAGCDGALQQMYGISSVAGLPVQNNPVTNTPFIPWSEVFPGGAIPSPCQDPVASNLLQRFVPAGQNGLYQVVPVGTINADQFTVRIDHKINDHQNFTAYYYFNDGRELDPYNTFEAAGANVPGFGSYNNVRDQQWNFSHTWTISNALVNEAHFTYMREGELGYLKNQTSNAVISSCTGSAATYCFTGMSDSSTIQSSFGTAANLGITPGLPSNLTGVPYVNISGGASFGNNFEGFLPQVGNSFQWTDELSWVKGTHTFKFGVDARRARFDQYYYFDVNGEYTFDNSGPNAIVPGDGDNYAEFLLGLADGYTQGSGQREDVRSTAVYPFAQDSWKIKPNLTLNYGLRWEFTPPPTDISGHVETFRPGQNSTVYPCGITTSTTYWQSLGVANPTCANTGSEPTGLVVPGDPGVPAGMTSTYYKAFAPRVGIAYSPGRDGKTSIRAGWGLFYNPIEELVLAQFGAEPPFGGSSSLSDVFFNTPFVNQGDFQTPNPFGGIITPIKHQPTDLSLFRPILLYGEFQPHLRSQYTSQYNLTFQRDLSNSTMLQIGYVGSQGHRLLASHDIDPSMPQTCLDIMSLATTNPGNVTSFGSQANCGPTAEDTQYIISPTAVAPAGGFHVPYGPNGPTVIPAGTSIGSVAPTGLNLVGLRPYSSPNCNPYTGTGCPVDGVPVFTDVFAEDTIANSSYNALEMMVQKRFSHGLQFQAAYTLSKSIDTGSTFEETLNPFNFGASRALSLFNSKQRFVVSYDWELPIRKYEGFAGRVLDDWEVSGITQFQSGFPIRLNTEDDTELINSLFFLGTEAPSLNGRLQILNPKTNGGFYLNYNQFSDPPLGQFNNGTQRTICCGPGLEDWDFSVHKKISLTEAKYLQFRAEIFNIFNRTNFSNPDGGYSDGPTAFGKITSAGDPRLLQFALKFFF
ncbi:MAG TPA: carboxypeptidase regulatory-like domain-containing protein [Candidatus Aquilonibacter sp.]|nr:carboxypeptidase regulatory-like domain-containing protein [Candidatus Aquilonibacter sp.]